MKRFSKYGISIAMFVIVAIPLLMASSAVPLSSPVAFEKVDVNVSDLIGVMGLNVYKFQLEGHNGQDFSVVWRSVDDQGNKKVLHSHAFRKDQEEPTTLLVSFLRRDDKLGGVLLSDQTDALYRLDCEGCTPSGLATVVALPLAEQHKHLFTHRSTEDLRRDDIDEVRLISVVQSEENGESPAPTDGPRVELVVEPK